MNTMLRSTLAAEPRGQPRTSSWRDASLSCLVYIDHLPDLAMISICSSFQTNSNFCWSPTGRRRCRCSKGVEFSSRCSGTTPTVLWRPCALAKSPRAFWGPVFYFESGSRTPRASLDEIAIRRSHLQKSLTRAKSEYQGPPSPGAGPVSCGLTAATP